jgi:hypothetical protein
MKLPKNWELDDTLPMVAVFPDEEVPMPNVTVATYNRTPPSSKPTREQTTKRFNKNHKADDKPVTVGMRWNAPKGKVADRLCTLHHNGAQVFQVNILLFKTDTCVEKLDMENAAEEWMTKIAEKYANGDYTKDDCLAEKKVIMDEAQARKDDTAATGDDAAASQAPKKKATGKALAKAKAVGNSTSPKKDGKGGKIQSKAKAKAKCNAKAKAKCNAKAKARDESAGKGEENNKADEADEEADEEANADAGAQSAPTPATDVPSTPPPKRTATDAQGYKPIEPPPLDSDDN